MIRRRSVQLVLALDPKRDNASVLSSLRPPDDRKTCCQAFGLDKARLGHPHRGNRRSAAGSAAQSCIPYQYTSRSPRWPSLVCRAAATQSEVTLWAASSASNFPLVVEGLRVEPRPHAPAPRWRSRRQRNPWVVRQGDPPRLYKGQLAGQHRHPFNRATSSRIAGRDHLGTLGESRQHRPEPIRKSYGRSEAQWQSLARRIACPARYIEPSTLVGMSC